jgi:hemolysin activation/secretion protein
VEKKEIISASFEVRHEAWHQIGSRLLFTELTGGITGGRLSYDDADQARANRRGVNTVGDFAYLTLGLKGRLNMTSNWSLEGSAKFQKSLNRNLDSAEQFIVTGGSGVRGYREVVSGDNGYLLSAQVSYRLPELQPGFDHSLGLFVDHGGWRTEEDWQGAGAENSDTLTDIGLSYRVYFDPLFLNIQGSRTLGSWPEGMRFDGRTHVLVNVGVFF